MSTLDEVLKEINKAKSIVLLVHENPDGDAIGSALAMNEALINLGKDVDLIIPKFPKTFMRLPGIDKIKSEGKEEKYDLAISLDCATIQLLNGWSNYFEDAKKRIVIDHHSSNAMYGDINFVEAASPACVQTLYGIFKYFEWEITADMSMCLMCGLITDTGGFQFSNVSKETLIIASELMELGANISKIYKQVLTTRTKPNYELRKIALDRMEFLEGGKIAFTYITQKDIKKFKAEQGDTEGIVDEGRQIEGIEVSIFIHEKEDKKYKVSLRSNEYVNVSDVCMIYGGGGHVRAAGAMMDGNPKQIRDKIVKEIKLQLKEQ